MGLLIESSSTEWVALGVILLTSIYFYYKSQYNYWKKKGVKHLKGTLPFGNIGDLILFRKPAGKVYKQIYDAYPEEHFVGIYQFSKPGLLVRDPELLKYIMVKDFSHFQDRVKPVHEKIDPLGANLVNFSGPKWQALRSKLTPIFTSGKMKMMFQVMTECADELAVYLDKPAKRGEMMEMKEVMAKFTTDIIGCCAFGLQFNSMKDENSEFRTMGRKVFETSNRNTLRKLLQNISPTLMKLLNITARPKEVNKFFVKAVKEMVEYREKNNIVRNDFIHFMIQLKNKSKIQEDAKPDELINNPLFEETNGHKKKVDIEFTDNILASQAFIFFLAGFETSSTTLSFCVHELAANPDVQKKLREEIDSTLKKYGGKMTYEGIQEMSYLDKVIDETLRKHPPAPINGRIVTKPYVIPETSLRLETGQSIIIPIYALHHDPKYYPHPERFDPERFTLEAKSARPHYTFMPFGYGPRNCIGLRFGVLQAKVGLTSLLSNFEFSVCEKTKIPIELDPRQIISTSKTGIWLRITKRS